MVFMKIKFAICANRDLVDAQTAIDAGIHVREVEAANHNMRAMIKASSCNLLAIKSCDRFALSYDYYTHSNASHVGS